ncbi:hypothetical protein lbkm_2806 [Lachnospiraceae bacterium KM106-2]|nr:hypothetical protein lbkm_2806 [Lachnospiraceae bacterium KM106-2]
MLQIGVQTKNIIDDTDPIKGFDMLRKAGFSCVDFSLNRYLLNIDLYQKNVNHFFDQSISELEQYFKKVKDGAKAAEIKINQMHMPYPIYIPNGEEAINDYLWNEVAPKSMKICAYLGCPYIVIHGFKLAKFLGSEEAEWRLTEKFIESIAPLAKELNITICIENLYDSMGGHLVEGPCCDVRKAVERIDRINEKYQAEILGFCFDTGHANLVGLDFESFLTTLGKRLKVLHIHDNDGIGDLHQIPFTFAKARENKSSTDWDGFINGLRNIGYDKVLNFETAPVLSAFPEEMKQDTLNFIARIGMYFAEQLNM